jgi:hypothetical protein
MTSKEKAEELVKKFIPHTRLFLDELGWTDCLDAAKCCAVIAVDEVLKSQKNIYGVNNKATTFYLDVKQEIEKL